MKSSRLMLIAALLVMLCGPALAAQTLWTWVGTGSGGDGTSWHDPLNWDLGTVPTGASDANLGNWQAHIGNGDTVQITADSGVVNVNWIFVFGGSRLELVDGGDVQQAYTSRLSVGDGGVFDMSGGQFVFPQGAPDVHSYIAPVTVGALGGGTINLSGGLMEGAGTLRVDSNVEDTTCTFNHTGGTLSFRSWNNGPYYHETIIIGASSEGGTSIYNLGDADGTGIIIADETETLYSPKGMVVGEVWHPWLPAFSAQLRGWGAVPLHGVLLLGGFSESYVSKVIADGYGTDRTLDISTFERVSHRMYRAIDIPDGHAEIPGSQNTHDSGWYAQNHGKLLMPVAPIEAGDITVYVGEDPLDPDIDLVNSIQAVSTGVNGGDLAVAIPAMDHADAAGVDAATAVGVWDVSGLDLGDGNVMLTFRYDDLLVADLGLLEVDLQVWHNAGVSWADVTASIETGANLITTGTLTSLSMFVVGTEKPSAPGLDGDVNGDCTVNILDLISVRNHLNQSPTTPPENAIYDVTGDGSINILDLIYVRNRLNTKCEEEE